MSEDPGGGSGAARPPGGNAGMPALLLRSYMCGSLGNAGTSALLGVAI